MRKKLFLLAIALMGFAASLGIQPRTAEASNCFCADPQCCNFCCQLASGKIICSLRAC